MAGVRRLIRVRRARRMLATTVVLLVVAGAAAGCSGSDGDKPAGPAPAPTGFKTHQASLYSISYPESWKVTEKPNPSGGPPILVIQGASGSGGFSPQIAVGHDTNYSSDFDDAMEIYRTVSIGKAGTVVSDQATSLAGADRAQRTEYTEQQPGQDGQQHTIRVVEVHALTADRTMYDVLVRAPKEDFDGAQLDKALDSFRILGAKS
jgi:hypothetical protein